MPKIILMNIGTEHALGPDGASGRPLAKSAWRHAWFAAEGDIIVSPVEIAEEFLRNIGDTLGFDARSVSVIASDRLLTDEVLLSLHIIDGLRRSVSDSQTWTIMPCFYTEGVAELAALLGIDDAAGSSFAAQRGGDLFNRKTHFRQLAAGARLPIAIGSIAVTQLSLAKAINTCLPTTGTVIVKRDDAAGGMGNITLTRGAVTPLPGSRETRHIAEDIRTTAAVLWDELTDSWSRALVVESYYTASHRFYFEYFIDGNGAPRFLNSGTIRLRPDNDPKAKELVWVGLDIPAGLPAFAAATAFTQSARFAMLAGQIGYRGPINIDAIVTDRGDIIFNETNGRWGGGLVLHTVGERLLGKGYADNHVLSSLRDVRSPARPDALRILRERGLQFNQQSREGAIVLACDERMPGFMECLVIGASLTRAREIESVLRTTMEL